MNTTHCTTALTLDNTSTSLKCLVLIADTTGRREGFTGMCDVTSHTAALFMARKNRTKHVHWQPECEVGND